MIEVVEPILVPQTFRHTVFDLVHNDALGGLPWAEKTEARIIEWYYCLGVATVVKRFCGS